MDKTVQRYVYPHKIIASDFLATYEDKEVAVDYAPSAGMYDQLLWLQVFPVGNFYTHHQMEDGFELTPAVFDDFVQNFHNKDIRGEVGVALYEGHGEQGGNDRPAVGWVKDLVNRGANGLWALLELTPRGWELIQSKAFRYISPEWYFDYFEPETGEEYKNVLTGIALVNEPYFSGMKALAANEAKENEPIIVKKDTMTLADLLSKKPEELSEEEKAFVKEHASELTEEQKTSFASVLTVEEKTDTKAEGEGEEDKKQDESEDKKDDGTKGDGDDKQGEGDAGEGAAKKEDDAAGKESADAGADKGEAKEAAPVAASEKGDASMVKITASRLAELEASENENQTMKMAASIEAMHHAPAIVARATTFAMKLKGSVRQEFLKFLETLPAVKKERVTSSEGEGMKPTTALEELEAKMKAHMEQTKSTDRNAAMDFVMKSDRKLAKRVDAERAGEMTGAE